MGRQQRQQQKQKYKEQYYQNFLDSLHRSDATKQKYVEQFKNYLKFLKVQDPDKLITESLLDSPHEIRQVENQIRDYIKYLSKVKGWGNRAISVARSSIFKFYEVNRVSLNRKYLNQFMPAQKRLRRDSAYTHKQIEMLLNSTKDKREKAMILLLASTGMRIGALPYLSIRNLTKTCVKGYPPDSYIYRIVVYEGEPEQYYCFTTFECAKAINDYLEHRITFGEVLKPEAPLLREKFNSSITGGAALAKPRFLKVRGFRTTIDRLLIQAGLRKRTAKKDKHLHENMESHGFRKFCNTQMIAANVEYNARQFLIGHRSAVGLDTSYDRTTEEDRLSEYMKAVELLTISPENVLRKKLAESDITVNMKLVQKDREIAQIRKDMEGIRRGYQQTIRLLKNPEFTELVRKKYKKS